MPKKPDQAPEPSAPDEKSPWRLFWVLIAILLYATFQTAYFLFFGEG